MPVPKTGKRSERQRQTQNRYQKENYIIVAAKMKKGDAEKLRAALALDGLTINSFVTACALDYIAAHAAPDQPKE